MLRKRRSHSNPWTIWACLPSVTGATVKARYAAPTREDCMWHPPFDSLFLHHDLQLCGPRSLPPSQKSNRRTVRPLTFPYSASSKPIPRRKNSFTTTLSRPKLLISTNITHPPKERKLSPNYSLDVRGFLFFLPFHSSTQILTLIF